MNATHGLLLQEAFILAKWLMGVTLRVAAANPGDEHAACLGSTGILHECFTYRGNSEATCCCVL